MKKDYFNPKKIAFLFTVLFMTVSVGTMFAQTTYGQKLTMKGVLGGTETSPRSIVLDPITAYLYEDTGVIETTFGKDLGTLSIVITNATTNTEVYNTTVTSGVGVIVLTDIACFASGDYIISFVNSSVNMYAEFQIE